MIYESLFIKKAKGKGRGVFTRKNIPADTVIEESPVIVMSAEDRILLDKTLLHDYIFEWGADNKACCMALGFISIYNHSYQSNCEYFMDFGAHDIHVKTVRDIAAGEEITINYNGDWNDEKRVWFEAED
ncbi:MAG TPA: SET domain-containing protein [Hanamia sp.]